MKDLGQLIREPEAAGWKVSNLFQLPGGWRCNLSGPEGRSFGHTEFSDGATPEEAVAAAVESMRIAKERGFASAEEKRALLVFENACRRLARTLGAAKGAF